MDKAEMKTDYKNLLANLQMQRFA